MNSTFQHENAQVFVGSSPFKGGASLVKLSLLDPDRRPTSMAIDPLQRLGSTRISDLKMIENTDSCLIGFLEGKTETGHLLSFVQIWDANRGDILMRCWHPLGSGFRQQTLGDNNVRSLLVRQHIDGLLFYFFPGLDAVNPNPRVVAQNPRNGVSVPVCSFQDPKRECKPRRDSLHSFFCNDQLIGVERDNAIALWGVETGNIIGEISLEESSIHSFQITACDRDNNFVISESDGHGIFVNFWSYIGS